MDLLLMANNVTSAMVILSSWWLAHEYARNGWRVTAGLIALIGFMVLVIGFARNFGMDPRWFTVATKGLIGVTFTFLLRENMLARRAHMFDERPKI